MRVITLLPSATEIVAALGGAGYLVGISHECDYPDSVQHLPRVTSTPLDVDAPGVILDAEVRRLNDAGQAVIGIETELLRRLQPDLIVTQSLCDVCAVSDGAVQRLAEALQPAPQVLSLDGRDLSRHLGRYSAGRSSAPAGRRGGRAGAGIAEPAPPAEKRSSGSAPPRRMRGVARAAVSRRPLGPRTGRSSRRQRCRRTTRQPFRRREWQDVRDLQPDHVLVMLCGFGIARARSELDALRDSEGLAFLSGAAVSIVDGNAYTSRAGPRVVDGAERIRAALSPTPGPDSPRWLPGR